MLEHIRGLVSAVRWDGDDGPAEVVVDTPVGLGFVCQVPSDTATGLTAGEEATLLLHARATDDSIDLYGFGSPAERALFRDLLGVSRVGPATALGVLSLGVAELKRIFMTEDGAALARVKGVGKKTAARLILEMKEKAASIDAGAAGAGGAPGGASGAATSATSDAAAALRSLGFGPAASRRAVERAVESLGPDADVEDLVREGLRLASRATRSAATD